MTEAFMAYPELRHPFETQPIHGHGETTVLYQGRTVVLDNTGPGPGLLIDPDDLPRINGFEVKPEGACFGDLCIPLHDDLAPTRAGRQWLDLTALADLLEQAYVSDADERVWSFAEIPAKRANMMEGAMAPELSIKDRQGNEFTLADLKGKKALIVTWSSW